MAKMPRKSKTSNKKHAGAPQRLSAVQRKMLEDAKAKVRSEIQSGTSQVAKKPEETQKPEPKPVALAVSTDELFWMDRYGDLPECLACVRKELPENAYGVFRQFADGSWSSLLKAWPRHPQGDFELHRDGHLALLPRSTTGVHVDVFIEDIKQSFYTDAQHLVEEPVAALILRRRSLILLYRNGETGHETGIVLLDPDMTGHDTFEEIGNIEADFPGMFRIVTAGG